MDERMAKHYLTGEPVRVAWKNGVITNVSADDHPGDGLYVAPGFLDIQINGFGGVNFGDPELTPARARQVAEQLWQLGVTGFLPTLITDSVTRMGEAVARIGLAAQEPGLRESIVGIHLEGPYLSSVDGPRGAHPLEHCKDPDWSEFQRLQARSGGLVRLMTLAPERAGAPAFIRQAVASGVRIAIGHTAANRDQILAGVDAGAGMSTHLGNAAHDLIQRHHNYLFDQLADDRLLASLIVDGHHLPPHLVNIFLRVKGIDRLILVSDAVQYAGLPAGIYDGGYRQFEVRDDGFIGVVGEPRLAGSGLMLVRGIENLIRFTGVSLADAIRTVTEIPARFLGLDHLGALAVGRQASLVLFRWDPAQNHIAIIETILAGNVVHRASQA